MFRKISTLLTAFALIVNAFPASANVTIGGTRVIYDGAHKEASISVINSDNHSPYLIQSWVENFNAGNTSKPPFIVTPPMFRLDAGKENILRILRTGNHLPMDRESIFWLSIKSIPSSVKSSENQLLISVKSRLKLIYRPKDLKGNPNEAYKSVVFIQQGKKLQAMNPTPFYVSFNTIKVNGREISLKDSATIAPQGKLSWELPSSKTARVSWNAVNDYGGVTEEISTQQ
ncbi:fimbrial biogenesis chaperone [Enterobacter sp. C4G1]|uniref:fimbrial biogenesis chaperone n=1 Tax=Enterobacter sp. C4G1 TaxID=3458724 RepID=UPI0040684B8B